MKLRHPFLALLSTLLTVFIALPSSAQFWSSEKYNVLRDEAVEAIVRVALFAQDQHIGFCSGALIAPRVVLTARHCVELTTAKEVIAGRGPNKISSLVQRIATPDMPRAIYNMFTPYGLLHPDYHTHTPQFVERDLVLLILETPIITITPLELYPGYLAFDEAKTLSLITAGYPSDSPLVDTDSYPEPVSLFRACQFTHEYLDGKVFTTNCAAAQGNSGGAVLTKIDGKTYVAGVISSGSALASVTEVINASHPEYRFWIEEIIRLNAVRAP